MPMLRPNPSFANGFARSAGESANPELWKGLVGGWFPSLGVQGSTLLDITGRGKHGVLTNTTPAAAWTVDERGTVLSYVSDDYISISDTDNASFGLPLPFTICIWVGPFSTPSNLVVGPEKNSNSGFSVQIANGAFRLNVGGTNPGTNTLQTALSSYNDSKPHFVVFKAIGINLSKVYVDAADRTSATANDSDSPAYGTSTPVVIGSRSGSFGFTGEIGNVMIFDRELTESEITTLFIRPSAPLELKRAPVFRVPAVGGRIMSSLVACGGLAGCGGIAGRGGGLAA